MEKAIESGGGSAKGRIEEGMDATDVYLTQPAHIM